MQHNFWLAKPYGLANQKLCYSQIWNKDLGEKEWTLWKMVDEYGPGSMTVSGIRL